MASESHPESLAIVVKDANLVELLMHVLDDPLSRRVVSSAIERGRTIEQISSEQKIPPSTCYRKVKELVGRGALIAERVVLTDVGKKRTVYRSTFNSVTVKLEDAKLSVYVTVNPDAVDKFEIMWRTTR